MADELDRAAGYSDRERDAGVARVRAQMGAGPAARECDECGDDIPQARREAVPGARLCVPCLTEAEHRQRVRG